MIEYFQKIVTSQYEAALCMARQCIESCPAEHWESPIANGSFRWVAYHMLFFADLYLSPSNEAFALRELHVRGGDEREDRFSAGLSQADTLDYVGFCRQKAIMAVARETVASLAGPSGFSWYPISRGEMHLVSLRHIQHHTGQLSAFLRKLDGADRWQESLRWVRSGWREPAAG